MLGLKDKSQVRFYRNITKSNSQSAKSCDLRVARSKSKRVVREDDAATTWTDVNGATRAKKTIAILALLAC